MTICVGSITISGVTRDKLAWWRSHYMRWQGLKVRVVR